MTPDDADQLAVPRGTGSTSARGAGVAARVGERASPALIWALVALAAVLALAVVTVAHDEAQPALPLLAFVVACYVVYAAAIGLVFPRLRASSELAAFGPERTAVGARADRVDWLLAIRGLAALLVFVMHTGIVFGRDWTWGGSPWAWAVFSPAWLGMVMFFALSGYLMGKGFYRARYTTDRAGVSAFLRNRWLRIAPLCLTVAPIIALLQSRELFSRPDIAVRISTFTFDGLNGGEGLGAFWSLSTEWQFYLAVPLIFIGLRKALQAPGIARLLVIQAGALLACTALRWGVWQSSGGTLAGWNPFVYTPVYCNLDVFLAGFLANWWRDALGKRTLEVLGRTWPFFVAALVLVYSRFAFAAHEEGIPDAQAFFALALPGLTALAMVPILLGAEVASANAAPGRWLPRALYWVGALTFPVYLVHTTILRSVQDELGSAPYLLRLATAIALTLAIAWALHMTVERFALSWRGRLGLRDAVRADHAARDVAR